MTRTDASSRFCLAAQGGRIPILAEDYPSFLYPEDVFDPSCVDTGLLRGRLLVMVRDNILLKLHSYNKHAGI